MHCTKTEAGQLAFKQRSADLGPRQRSAFLLFDGQRSVADVLKATEGLGITQADIEEMLAKGFLEPLSRPAAGNMAAGAASATSHAAPDTRTAAERYSQAYPLATQLTAQMGLRGFRLNLAVEAASGLDDLIALLPKLTEALGPNAVRAFKEALGEH
jgi:hypothetical protein